MDVFYIVAFLAIYIHVLFFDRRRKAAHLKVVVWAYLALIIVQCFVFPYGTEDRLLQIFEDVEGAVIVELLVAFLLRMDDAPFGQACLIAIVVLELAVAVENVAVPFSTIVDDFQAVDIPLNYAALFMRPVLFGSLALAYRVWLDHRRAAERKQPTLASILQDLLAPESQRFERSHKPLGREQIFATAYMRTPKSPSAFYRGKQIARKTENVLKGVRGCSRSDFRKPSRTEPLPEFPGEDQSADNKSESTQRNAAPIASEAKPETVSRRSCPRNDHTRIRP